MDEFEFARCRALFAAVLEEAIAASLADHSDGGREALESLRVATSSLIVDRMALLNKSGKKDNPRRSMAEKLAEEFFSQVERLRKQAVALHQSAS